MTPRDTRHETRAVSVSVSVTVSVSVSVSVLGLALNRRRAPLILVSSLEQRGRLFVFAYFMWFSSLESESLSSAGYSRPLFGVIQQIGHAKSIEACP